MPQLNVGSGSEPQGRFYRTYLWKNFLALCVTFFCRWGWTSRRWWPTESWKTLRGRRKRSSLIRCGGELADEKCVIKWKDEEMKWKFWHSICTVYWCSAFEWPTVQGDDGLCQDGGRIQLQQRGWQYWDQNLSISVLFLDPLNVKVLYKLKKGLESENADMNRDVESEYREILKWVQLEESRKLQRLRKTQNNLKIIRSVMRPNQEGDGGQEAVRWQCAENWPEVSKAGAPHSGEGVDRERNAKSQNTKCQIQRDKYLSDRCLYRGKNTKVMNNQYNE